MTLLRLSEPAANTTLLFIALANSFIFDFTVRSKMGGRNLSQYVFKQLAAPTREALSRSFLGSQWFLERAMELTYTDWSLAHFAAEAGFYSPPFRWDPTRRELLEAELDAAFFVLYGLSNEDVSFILDSFWIVRNADIRSMGEYGTKRRIMVIIDRMKEAIDTGQAYRTPLDPPPAHPSLTHPESTRPDWAKPD